MKSASLLRSLIMGILIGAFISPVSWSHPQDLDHYQVTLQKLSTSEPESILQAVQAYNAHFNAKTEHSEREQAFQSFLKLYQTVLENLVIINPVADVPQDDNGRLNQQAFQEVENYYQRYGLAITQDEGIWHFTDNPRFLKKHFGQWLNPAWNAYLDLRVMESSQKFASDAAILIPWDAMLERILAWEVFLKQYPNFPLNQEIQDIRNNYLRFYLTGMDNTPAFGLTSRRLAPEARKSFERFISESRHSPAYPIVDTYYQLLKKNKFKGGCQAFAYLASQQVIPYPETWYRKRITIESDTQDNILPNLHRRLNLLNVSRIEPLGQGRYLIELPAESKAKYLALALKSNPGEAVFFKVKDGEGKWQPSELSSGSVESTSVEPDIIGFWGVRTRYTPQGSATLAKVTEELAKTRSPLGIFQNETLLSEPKVQEAITVGETFISGQFTYDQALELAIRLNNSPLPSPIRILDIQTTEPRIPKKELKNDCM